MFHQVKTKLPPTNTKRSDSGLELDDAVYNYSPNVFKSRKIKNKIEFLSESNDFFLEFK